MGHQTIGQIGDEDFPAEPAMSVRAELSAGETLVWQGRPRAIRHLVLRTVPKALFGLVFIALTLFWIVMVVRGGNNNWDKGRAVRPFELHNVAIAAFAALWMIPPGLYLLTWPLRTWRRLKGTCYALTDRRAIISEPGFVGQPRVRSHAAGSLRLMRLEEHDDGTGNLIFECPSTWVGMAQTVGFLAIADAREVEALVRRTLLTSAQPRSKSPSQAATGPAPARSGRTTYRLALSVRLFQFVALACSLLVAFCVIGNLVLFLFVCVAVPIFKPRLLVTLTIQMKQLGVLGVAGYIVAGVGSLLGAVLVGWNFLHFALVIPIEIIIDEDRTVGFRSRLRTITMPAGDIISIRTGSWYDPNRFQAVVRHKGGKLTLINQFADFRDFLATLRELNPAVEIIGF